MDIFQRFGQIISLIEEALEKGERKIIRPYQAPKPTHTSAHDGVEHGVKGSQLSFHTGKVKYAPAGTAEKPHDHATYSEHVIIHNGKPIGFATVHHAHPSDHNKVKGGKLHDHSVDIHAPGVHYAAHSIIAAKVKEHVNSSHFRRMVDEHNEKTHGYTRPKVWLGDKKDKK